MEFLGNITKTTLNASSEVCIKKSLNFINYSKENIGNLFLLTPEYKNKCCKVEKNKSNSHLYS